MSAALPVHVDVWRMVQAQRSFEGSLPLARFARLRGSLANADGSVDYALQFGRDALNVAYLQVQASVGLSLVCQRTLETFVRATRVDQRLGLITDEAQEAALPPGYEPLLVEGTQLNLIEVIEDELILSLPVVALGPGAPLGLEDDEAPVTEEASPNPFAALAGFKSRH